MPGTPSTYYTEANSHITVTVTNTPISGEIFAVMDGGGGEAETELIRPGNMAKGIAIGGIVTPEMVTLEVSYNDITAAWVGPLYEQLGKASVTSSATPKNGNAEDNEEAAITWEGILKSVTPPKRDSYSSTKQMLKITFAPNEGVKTG
jgi:hypothetical protein